MSTSNKLQAEATAIDAYTAWTDRVAVYPITAEPYYLALGIVDEYGEFLSAGTLLDSYKELGDIMWYLCRYSKNVLNVDPGLAWEAAHSPTLIKYGHPKQAIAALCGIEKKRIRDGAGWSDEAKMLKHGEALRAVCNIMESISDSLGDASIIDVLQTNMNKLEDRKARDLIRGDGDNR